MQLQLLSQDGPCGMILGVQADPTILNLACTLKLLGGFKNIPMLLSYLQRWQFKLYGVWPGFLEIFKASVGDSHVQSTFSCVLGECRTDAHSVCDKEN